MKKLFWWFVWWLGNSLVWLARRLNPDAPPEPTTPQISYVQPGNGGANIPSNHAE